MKTINKSSQKFAVVKNNLFSVVEQIVSAEKNGSNIIVPHVCNNINAFGAGFAGAVAQKYPIVKENYHMLGLSFLKKNPGHSQFVSVYQNSKTKNQLIFANMIAQNGLISEKNTRPLNYAYLVKSMINVRQYVLSNFDSDTRVEIHAPKFGCGLAGGNWNFVSDLINDIWYDLNVIVYDYKK